MNIDKIKCIMCGDLFTKRDTEYELCSYECYKKYSKKRKEKEMKELRKKSK